MPREVSTPSYDKILRLSELRYPFTALQFDDSYTLNRYSKVSYFFWRVVSLLTCGFLRLNRALDAQLSKIDEVVRRSLPPTSEERQKLGRALQNVVEISKANFGSLHARLEPLIRRCASHSLNIPLGETSWKRGLGKHETQQTLEEFHAYAEINQGRTKLLLIPYGPISSDDQLVLRCLVDYLKTIYGLQVSLSSQSLDHLDSSKRERAGKAQYGTDAAMAELANCLPEDSFCLGITAEDLYTESEASINFLFGIGRFDLATGMFSLNRFKGQGQALLLKRSLKLISHEFGHMRGMMHDVNNQCTMQGINSLTELDRSTLIFCTEDMEKICSLRGTTLRAGYEEQLRFFETFPSTYPGTSCDFSKEISRLKELIEQL